MGKPAKGLRDKDVLGPVVIIKGPLIPQYWNPSNSAQHY
jgi:hypothetical protein